MCSPSERLLLPLMKLRHIKASGKKRSTINFSIFFPAASHPPRFAVHFIILFTLLLECFECFEYLKDLNAVGRGFQSNIMTIIKFIVFAV